ncbi:MAG: hypothetical protein V4466_11625 [Pseudomonadota bacterium]
MTSLSWTRALQLKLAGGTVSPAILFRCATDPLMRLWAGAGDLAIGADNIETEDAAVYTGMGELLSAPQVNALVNGLAERVEFSLSGAAVSGEVAAIASTEADDIRDVAVNLGFFVFGPDGQQLTPTLWLWDGLSDSLKVSRQASGADVTRAIALSVGSLLTGRQRPELAYFSPYDQRRRSPDDAFCDHVPSYQQGTTKRWPI